VGRPAPHIAIGSKSRQQTIPGASTSPAIRGRALIAAADAFHGIGLARLFALLTHVSRARVGSPPDPANEKATPYGAAFYF